jgi:BspA type Leucine rich repeat region (6 copies)
MGCTAEIGKRYEKAKCRVGIAELADGCLIDQMRFVLLLSLFFGSAFQAVMGEQSGDWTYSVENNQAIITGYTGTGGAVTIPSSVNGIPVVQLSKGSREEAWPPIFSSPNTSVTSVYIPDSVRSIGVYAFINCTGLTSVTIPNNVTSIGDGAFYGCTGLISITIPDSVTSIGSGAFSTCTSLSNVNIGNSVTSIGDGAFYGCTGLISITIPNNVTSIGGSAFYGCTGLTGTLTIPNNVTSIGGSAFYGCTGLTGALTIPNSVTSIGRGAFQKCSGLTGTLTIPNSVTSIGESSFAECTGLTEIFVHPDNPNYSSEDGVLYDKLKTNLISFPAGKAGAYIIPSSVTTIGGWAFYYCASLTSVTIPESVTSISNENVVWRNGFMGCTSLTAISVDSDNPNYCSEDGVLFNKTKTTLIACPGGKTGAYTIPSSVTNIEQRAFRFCVSLAGIIIPNSVTSIPLYAFEGCAKLTSVIIPSSVTGIGGSAFTYCNSIVSIFIPNSVTSIAFGAFGIFSYQKSTSLERVLLPVRFEQTYQNFGLTASQVSFYDASSSSFIAGQQSVVSDPIANNLYTSSQYSDNFVLGRNSVLNSPNTHNLYTANQMQTLAFGDLVLTKNANGSFTLNYDIEQSTDLQNWSTYAPLSTPLTGLPADKAFVRIKAKQ